MKVTLSAFTVGISMVTALCGLVFCARANWIASKARARAIGHLALQEVTSALQVTSILSLLREGRQEAAVELLENALDTHVISLWSEISRLDPEKRQPAVCTLRTIRKYRERFPHTCRADDLEREAAHRQANRILEDSQSLE